MYLKCQPYVCPVDKSSLEDTERGLMRNDGLVYQFAPDIRYSDNYRLPILLSDEMINDNLETYNSPDSSEIYDNFLSWLFDTFRISEKETRNYMISKLFSEEKRREEKRRFLITGAGNGHDVEYLAKMIGEGDEVYAQDLSLEMMKACAKMIDNTEFLGKFKIYLSVSNAMCLPFANGYFDGVYHFGGINLFPDVGVAIDEMNRVVKCGGKVVFGDEGIAPWLKDKEYGRMLICNNRLWAASCPLNMLPETAKDVEVTWILGNCFYVIAFTKSDSLPYVDIDRVHIGTRGGSIRTRYWGQLEGISPEIKKIFLSEAKNRNISSARYLENIIRKELNLPEV